MIIFTCTKSTKTIQSPKRYFETFYLFILIKLYTQKKYKKNRRCETTVLNFLFFLVKKLSCLLNDTGSTKLVKIHTAIRTKSSVVRLAKKLTYLNDIKTSFLEPFKLFIFYKKILHALKALKA